MSALLTSMANTKIANLRMILSNRVLEIGDDSELELLVPLELGQLSFFAYEIRGWVWLTGAITGANMTWSSGSHLESGAA